jgi:hypothetical protein
VIRRAACLLATITMAGALGCRGDASLPRGEQTVDGVAVYLGIVPAALVQGHSTKPGDPQALHGGTPAVAASHHVMVALFDAETGARITVARVQASVGGSVARMLEPMEVNGLMTYGNFFALGRPGVERIRVEILLPGEPTPIEANFAYQHDPGT